MLFRSCPRNPPRMHTGSRFNRHEKSCPLLILFPALFGAQRYGSFEIFGGPGISGTFSKHPGTDARPVLRATAGFGASMHLDQYADRLWGAARTDFGGGRSTTGGAASIRTGRGSLPSIPPLSIGTISSGNNSSAAGLPAPKSLAAVCGGGAFVRQIRNHRQPGPGRGYYCE